MIKLKEIIQQLNDKAYNEIEEKLIKTKADNFIFLLRSYRNGNVDENEIAKKLNWTPNSQYVLKSRLYSRIQDELISDENSGNKNIYIQLAQINNICYNSPRVLAIAFLLKLEKDLLAYDMNGELLIVYSALKKLHYNTDKYFHYSQLRNKHAAFWLSLEKTNDILSDFNLLLEQYDFSRSPDLIKKMEFLKKEIDNHYALNQSRHINIIKKIIAIQLYLFCNIEPSDGNDTGDVIKDALQLISELPDSSVQKNWHYPMNYLAFEYYLKTGQINKAKDFYNKTNDALHTLLLFSNISLTAKFLTAKIEYHVLQQTSSSITTTEVDGILINDSSMYTVVHLGIYNAMAHYYSGEFKKAISTLNLLLNDFSFKDNFHIQMQIKLTLTFLYLKIKDVSAAESLVDGISKKIKTEKLSHYSHVLDLIKFFNTLFKTNDTASNSEKRKELLILYLAKNIGDYKMLDYLNNELKKTYLKN
ncbi:MAG: hypothetical protein JWO32_1318 [Bacteroidetes bacterium]|nr:hypothetical protein [Bacteroidota bacterium]